jgi:hypothetical protein
MKQCYDSLLFSKGCKTKPRDILFRINHCIISSIFCKTSNRNVQFEYKILSLCSHFRWRGVLRSFQRVRKEIWGARKLKLLFYYCFLKLGKETILTSPTQSYLSYYKSKNSSQIKVIKKQKKNPNNQRE